MACRGLMWGVESASPNACKEHIIDDALKLNIPLYPIYWENNLRNCAVGCWVGIFRLHQLFKELGQRGGPMQFLKTMNNLHYPYSLNNSAVCLNPNSHNILNKIRSYYEERCWVACRKSRYRKRCKCSYGLRKEFFSSCDHCFKSWKAK